MPRPGLEIWIVEAIVLIGEITAAADRIAAARDAAGVRVARTDPQWRMLRALARAWGRLSIADVGRCLRISRQAAHGVVVAAARAGLVRLDTNPHDRRLIQIELTKLGRGTLLAAEKRRKAWVITLLNGLDTRELRATSHVLRVMRQRLVRDERGK